MVPSGEIYSIIEEYLGSNLPGFFWRGYAGKKMIVDVNLHRRDLTFTREIKLVENWRELLRESRTIHFLHEKYEDRAASLNELIRNNQAFKDNNL